MTLAHAFGDDRRPVQAAITVVLLVMLLAATSRFTAKPDPGSRWFAVVVFFEISVVSILYGLGLLYFSRRVIGRPSFPARLQEVVYALVGADGQVQLRTERFTDFFHGTLLGLGLATVAVVAYLALRPAEPIARLTPADETQLRDLLTKHGERDSLGYFALRRDKSVVWSPTRKAAITYRVVQGVALASGDPIGDPEAWPGAMAAYRRLVEEYAWTPAVIACSEQGATVFKRECGLSAIELGEEAIIEVSDFSLDGRAMRGVRQACTRIARAGYTVQVRRARDIEQAELAAPRRRRVAWRRGRTRILDGTVPPRRPADPDCVIATACLAGALRGVLHFVPWGSDGLSLDLMRRDRTADNGLNEFMIEKVLAAGPALGVQQVSLNFAVFRDALERGRSAPDRCCDSGGRRSCSCPASGRSSRSTGST